VFLKGEGEIVRTTNSLTLKPSTEEVVIKYRYLPNLKISPSAGVEIFPYPVYQEEFGGGRVEQVSFIGLKVEASILQSSPSFKISF